MSAFRGWNFLGVFLSGHGRTTLRLTALLVACMALVSVPAIAQEQAEPQPASANPKELVAQLADNEYQVRSAAENGLIGLGVDASDALREGLKSKDVQIRRRCRWILDLVADAEFGAQLEQLRSAENFDTVDLPSWQKYREICGDSKEARDFFIKMMQQERGLLESFSSTPERAVAALQFRLMRIRSQMYARTVAERKYPDVVTISALAFVNACLKIKLDSTAFSTLNSIVAQQKSSEKLKKLAEKHPAKQLLSVMIVSGSSPSVAYSYLSFAARMELKSAGNRLALAIIKDAQQHNTRTVAGAIGLVGMYGGKDYLGALGPLLKDKRSCGTTIRNKKRWEVQVRDVAALWIIYASKLKLSDYGFDSSASGWLKNAERYKTTAISSFTTIRFKSEDDRTKSLAKLEDWIKKNPLKLVEYEPAPKQDVKVAQPMVNRVVQPAKTDDAEGGVLLADYDLIRQIRIADELIRNDRHEEALAVVGQILQLDTNYVFRPERGEELFRSLKAEAEKVLQQMPVDKLKINELLHGNIARLGLENALRQRDMEQLSRVQEQFLYTESGSQAAYILGAYYRQKGQHHLATLYLRRVIERSGVSPELRSSAMLELAITYALTGDQHRAQETLEQWKQTWKKPNVEIGGRLVDVFDRADQSLAWLKSVASFVAPMENTWLVWRGALSGNSPQFDLPWTEGTNLHQVSAKVVTQSVDRLKKEVQERRLGIAPTVQPVVIGDLLIVRTPTELLATNHKTGEVAWIAPSENHVARRLRLNANDDLGNTQKELDRQLKRRLFQDISWGAISSNGRYVFALEDISFDLGAGQDGVVTQMDGTRVSNFADFDRENLLSAYDASTGKLVWQIGTAFGETTPGLAGGEILAPPVPIDNLLFVPVSFQGNTRLIKLDTESGKIRDQWILETHEEPSRTVSRYTMLQPRPISHVAPPTCLDGVLVTATPNGKFVAVDVVNGAVLWSHKMDITVPTGIHPSLIKTAVTSKANSFNHWFSSSALLTGDRALLSTFGGEELHCISLHDGRLLWKAPRLDGLYLGGVGDGVIAIVGRSGVRGLKLDDGSEAWPTVSFPRASFPTGIGYSGDSILQVPLQFDQIVRVDLRNGALIARVQMKGTKSLGNLVHAAGEVFSVAATSIERFAPFGEEQKLVLARLESDDQPDAWLQRAQIELARGNLEQGVQLLVKYRNATGKQDGDALLLQSMIALYRQDEQRFAQVYQQLTEFGPTGDITPEWLTFSELLAGSGQLQPSLEILTQSIRSLLEAEPKTLEKMESVSVARVLRIDRMVSAVLNDIRGRLDESLLDQWNESLDEAYQTADTKQKIDLLGEHPGATDRMLEVAKELIESKKYAEAIDAIVATKDQDQLSPAALEQYASALEQTKHPWDQKYLERLNDPDASVPWENLWNLGEKPSIKKEAMKRNSSSVIYYGMPSAMVMQTSASSTPLELSLVYDTRTLTLLGYDRWSRKRISVKLPALTGRLSGMLSPYYTTYRAITVGHMLIGYRGDIVFAIDCSGDTSKLVWQQKLYEEADATNGILNLLAPMRAQRMQLRNRHPDSEPAAIAGGPGFVCFQRRDTLMAVEPTTGNVIWKRDDIPAGCDIMASAEHVVVTPLTGEQGYLLRSRDGKLLRRFEAGTIADRVAVVDGSAVQWIPGPGGTKKLGRLDPLTGKTVWSIEAKGIAPSNQAAGVLAVVLPEESKIDIINGRTGAVISSTPIPSIEGDVQDVSLIAYEDTFVVTLDVKPKQPPAWPIFRRAFVGQKLINGRIFGISRSTGKRLWDRSVDEQAFMIQQPSAAPVFVLAHRDQQAVRQNNGGIRYQPPKLKVLCLDVRTGKPLYERSQDNWRYQAAYTATLLPEKKLFQLELYDEKVSLSLAE